MWADTEFLNVTDDCMYINHWAETFNTGSITRINKCCFSGGDSINGTVLSGFAGY